MKGLGKLERIREMDAAELTYRLRERCRLGLERVGHGLPTWRSRSDGAVVGRGEESDSRFLKRLPETATRGSGVLDYLRNDVAPRFYVPGGTSARDDLRALFTQYHPHWLARAAREADRLCEHHIELLGFGELDCAFHSRQSALHSRQSALHGPRNGAPVSPPSASCDSAVENGGAVIDWHRDPLTGAQWRRRFWADYDLVREPGPGDPKRVHELNRHQHLPRLAKAYFLLGEERYAREAVAQLSSWIDHNPPKQGVHWHSSLEISLRVVSWLWTLLLLLTSRALDEAAARRILKSLFAQLRHVFDYPSLYSSPNTHLLGEATALYLAGLLFRDCREGGAWLERGRALLIREIERQVGADGVHGELSTWYHCYAVDSYLQVVALARRNGESLPEEVHRRLRSMIELVRDVTRPDGSLPLLGDDDGGRALALAERDYRSASDLLASGAVLFGRSCFKASAVELRETTLWLFGREGHRAFEALAAEPPRVLRAAYPEAGYFIQRSGWGSAASHLIFDCGSLGKLGGGHGHADALSLTLFAGGRELLVDPGTYVYNGEREWRDYFRSTRAHNTVVVDGRSQSEPAGTFRWQRGIPVRPLLDVAFDGGDAFAGVDVLGGEHEGYAQGPAPLIHRRRVLFVRPDYWLVFDDFRGKTEHTSEHTFEVLYHLAPSCEVTFAQPTGERSAQVDVAAGASGLTLLFSSSAPLALEVARGERTPVQGWVSARYGEKQPASTVVARLRSRVPASIISVLVPRRGAQSAQPGWESAELPARLPGEVDGRTPTVSLRHRDGRLDVALLSTGADEVELETCRARGEIFWARFEGQRLTSLLGLEASSFRCGPRTIFSSAEPRNHFFAEADLRVGHDLEAATGPTFFPPPNPAEPSDVRHCRNP